MKIGIVFKAGNKKAGDLAEVIEKYLGDKQVEVVGESNLAGADYILSLGGDGTLIHKACEHAHFGATFVGINTGNLGFLTAVDEADWKKAVDAVLGGKIYVSERISLIVKIGKEEFTAVNEIAIKGLYRVVDLSVSIKGEDFLRISGDGVIVASQTGSTAYSLSSGGPIVDPDLDALLVTPINPIGLPIPSVVLSPKKEVEVEIVKGKDVSLIIDGQEHTKISQSEIVRVWRGKDRVKLGYLSRHHFIGALNAKFGLAGRLLK